MSSSSTASESVPVGFRFHPTDEELINHYLKLKLLGKDSKVQHVIPEVDVCKFEPWDLPARSMVKSDDPEWFFFCPRGYKYSNSTRSNRATKAGYWKVTGKEREIKTRVTKTLIGKKRTLVFHKRNPSRRTKWVMHEYYSVETFPDQRPFVICRLKEKPDEKNVHNGDDGEPSSHIVPHSGNEDYTWENVSIPEVYDQSEVNLESLLRPSQPLDQYPSALQSLDTEQQINFPFSSGSSYACNELQHSFEADISDEDPTDFLNSVLLDNEEYSFQETIHPLLNVSSQQFSFQAEEGHGLHFLTPGRSASSSSFLDEPVGMEEYLQMQMVRTQSGTSKLDQSKKDKNVSLHNQLSMQNSSSVSFTEDLPSINCISLATNSIIEKPRKPQSQPRSIKVIKQGVASRRIQLKSEGLPAAVSGNKAREAAAQNTAADLPQKEKPDAESKEERKTVQDKSDFDVSPGRNWKSFFVFVETPCKSSPPSVYFFNALIGVLLFAVFVREAFLYGNCC